MNIHDIYAIFARYFRTKRMRSFQKEFDVKPNTKVLDVGGSDFNWKLLPDLPKPIMVNLYTAKSDSLYVVADGRYLPFRDKSFDIVYSNSVIEHLRTIENQQLFADECRRVGRRYYVQTPNKFFPVEPHFLTPIIHYFPKEIQKKLIRYTILALLTTTNEANKMLEEVRLLDKNELQNLFPDAEIWHERFLGLTKSLIAVRR